MAGIGGATSGHTWRDHDLVENHARLNAALLRQTGALCEGAVTQWQWANGVKAYVRAAHGKIFLTGDCVQSIRFGAIPLTLMHGGERMRFFCPVCGRGCYYLSEKESKFACRQCCGYDWQCRHRKR
ncbi:hypothetical protein CQ12_10750 [Bradyrhizobium jicamae]|uniref:Uncharacterized protein n=2 Tax=Bradyrhizobium jicamae TaxID=280332 RepID=A0A0R3M3E4_9BRAD|nr:hypothetical protein CQ12_10750 [Bradyrhizobium jicamae]